MGPSSSDTGYLLGNLVYEYIAWFHHEENLKRQSLSSGNTGLYPRFNQRISRKRVYCTWDQDRESRCIATTPNIAMICCEPISKRSAVLPAARLSAGSVTVCRCRILMCSRIGQPELCQRLSLLIADALIMKREEMESADDIISLIETITYRYFDVMKALKSRNKASETK